MRNKWAVSDIDIVGKKFGKLTGINRVENGRFEHRNWLCVCECGNNRVVRGSELLSGKVRCCGCSTNRSHRKTHGLCKHQLYKVWNGIKRRCYNIKNDNYSHYGGRGIIMCDEWKNDFLSFYNWSINNGWLDGLTIDRFPNKNGNYEPNNCRWVDMATQNRNRNDNVNLECNGLKMTITEFSRISGVNRATIEGRLKRGWSVEDAIYKDSKSYHKKKKN